MTSNERNKAIQFMDRMDRLNPLVAALVIVMASSVAGVAPLKLIWPAAFAAILPIFLRNG